VSALVFLAVAVVLSIVGCVYLWYKHRAPNTLDSGIEAFRREMEALAPQDDDDDPQGRWR
jgi:hypothetical protein